MCDIYLSHVCNITSLFTDNHFGKLLIWKYIFVSVKCSQQLQVAVFRTSSITCLKQTGPWFLWEMKRQTQNNAWQAKVLLIKMHVLFGLFNWFENWHVDHLQSTIVVLNFNNYIVTGNLKKIHPRANYSNFKANWVYIFQWMPLLNQSSAVVFSLKIYPAFKTHLLGCLFLCTHRVWLKTLKQVKSTPN